MPVWGEDARARRPIVVAWALVLVIALPACRKVAEREGIRRYVRAEKTLREPRRRLEALLTKLEGLAGVAPRRHVVRAELLPAARGYLARLRAVPTPSDALRKIHRLLVQAWENAADRLARFATEAQGTALAGLPQALRKVEKRYRQRLRAHFRRHDFRRAR